MIIQILRGSLSYFYTVLVRFKESIRNHPVLYIMVGTILSLSLSIAAVEFLHIGVEAEPNTLTQIIFSLVFMLAVFVPIPLLFFALRSAYFFPIRRKRFATIISSYFCIIIVFTGYYYWAANLGDALDASFEYRYYQRLSKNPEGAGSLRQIATSKRSFTGIERRLWLSVGDIGRIKIGTDSTTEVPLSTLVETAGRPIEEIVEFNPQARLPVFMSCLYFSITTITTLGYGDLAPRAWYTRALAMIEVVLGILLFVVALAMYFGNKPIITLHTRNKDYD